MMVNKEQIGAPSSHIYRLKQPSQLVAIPLVYILGFNIYRQMVVPTKISVYGFDVFFLSLLGLVFLLRPDWRIGFKILLSNSSFRLKERGAVVFMIVAVIEVVLLAELFKLKNLPANSRVHEHLFELIGVGPYIEEIIGRCLWFETLLPVLPVKIVLATNLFFWLSIHELGSSDVLALITFSTISGLCYLRFRSLTCCFVLHALWNLLIV